MKDGIIKIGVCPSRIKICDCTANAQEIIELTEEMAANGIKLAAFSELCVTGYTAGDLIAQPVLLKAAEEVVKEIISATASLDILLYVGAPVAVGNKLYNCAAAINKGRLLALSAKTNIANYTEFYEKRYFSSAPSDPIYVKYAGFDVPLGAGILLECDTVPGLVVGAEICEDLWVPAPPSNTMAVNGATVIFNLSCSNEIVGKSGYRKKMVSSQSGRLLAAYAYVSAGEGESTSDMVYDAHCMIYENSIMLAEQRWNTGKFMSADVDIDRLCFDRRRITSFSEGDYPECLRVHFSLDVQDTKIQRRYSKTPFVPTDVSKRNERCEEILNMQSHALATRLKAINCSSVVIGLSGGLDSTLALIAAVRTFDLLGLDRKRIITITMPCFGTTAGTRSNAHRLAAAYGVTLREIPIAEAANIHLRDIGHDGVTTDVTYENTQARERTQILMDIANMEGAIVVGTGDLSEIALGWSTYNGDHMSMYGINSGIPKTLVRYIVSYEALTGGEELSSVLTDIFNTPVSPELLPPKDGDISQKTEHIVGPYELHDFFLYYHVRFGCRPDKIYRLARVAFGSDYDGETIKKWLIVFIRRFFTQQFKRNCMPDGPKIGSVALSPRGDWRMPSDASYAEWMKIAENINTED